nr:MAG TPA: hypothetical protein [Caudoviricetes sp.]
MVEVEKSYASKGIAGTALGFGIGGTALSLLNGGMGLLGGRAATCSENMPVSRYEQEQQAKIAKLEADVALRDANTYGDQKMLEMYKYIEGQLKEIRGAIGQQAVHNQRTEDSFALVRQDVASVKQECMGAVAQEAERRCCGDNSIVTYANATFYPKMVAEVTTGTATTAQTLYNPLPKCGGCCCN